MHKVVLIGGGGHAESCISVIEGNSSFEIIGILDKFKPIGSDNLGYPILGGDELIPFYSNKVKFLITIGEVKTFHIREAIYNSVTENGGELITCISRSAQISRSHFIGHGTIVMHNTLVSNNVKIGNNCIINNFSNIEHGATIGNHTHISTGVMVNGNCKIGNNCFIGSGSILKDGITICDNVITGAGSLIVKDIIESGVYLGSPCRKISG